MMVSMRHETEFSIASETRRLRDRATASDWCCGAVSEGLFAGRGGANAHGQSADHQSLACRLEVGRPSRARWCRTDWPQEPVVGRRLVSSGGCPLGRSLRVRIRDGTLDAEANRSGDSPRIRSYLSRESCVEGSGATRMELPTSRAKGSRTQ